MIKKYSVFFLVVALFVQHNVADERLLNLLDLQAQVARGIQNIKHDAEAKSEEANGLVLQFTQQLTNIQSDKLQDAEKTITNLKLSTELELSNGVINSGGAIDKITSCTKEYETELEEFWKAAAKNVTGCVTERIEQGIQIIKNIVDASKTIVDIGVGLPNRIDTNCPLASNLLSDRILQALCALGQISIASTELLPPGIIIAKNALEGYLLINSVSSVTGELYTCLAARALTASVNFVPVLVPIVQCTLK